jgi:hypothetical protein
MTFVSALASIGVTGALTGALGTTAGTIAAGALAGTGSGAVIGGVGSALTGGDIGEGMGMGALTGAVGGGITGGLQSMASPAMQAGTETAKLAVPAATEVAPQQIATNLGQGIGAAPAAQAGAQLAPGAMQVVPQQVTANPITAPSFSEQIGNFAVNNPTLTAGITGLAAGTMIDNANAPEAPPMPTQPQSKFSYVGPQIGEFDPNKFRRSQGFATGGITDLDTFGSNSMTVPNNNTINIPNSNEVADPEGYGGESIKMLASGGVSSLGSYSDGGQLLRGPGDGVSDDIPAIIGGSQPARLAEGEFVVPARIVSELGNGSTEAGAKRLYEMMDRVQAGRSQSIGHDRVAVDTKAYRHLPA